MCVCVRISDDVDAVMSVDKIFFCARALSHKKVIVQEKATTRLSRRGVMNEQEIMMEVNRKESNIASRTTLEIVEIMWRHSLDETRP